MPDIIVDGQGTGNAAGVTVDNRLRVASVSFSGQHKTAYQDKQGFQVIGQADLADGVVVPLHIKNNSESKDLIITYIRHQLVGASGGTSYPNVSNFLDIRLGQSYASGGAAVTAVNTNTGTSNAAPITAYEGATLSGDAKVLDKWYTKADGDMNTFNKEGALIIAPQGTLSLVYTGDNTSGIIYSRVSFYLKVRG